VRVPHSFPFSPACPCVSSSRQSRSTTRKANNAKLCECFLHQFPPGSPHASQPECSSDPLLNRVLSLRFAPHQQPATTATAGTTTSSGSAAGADRADNPALGSASGAASVATVAAAIPGWDTSDSFTAIVRVQCAHVSWAGAERQCRHQSPAGVFMLQGHLSAIESLI
jgi:hypothetical protein